MGLATGQKLKNGVPCKLDARGNPVIDKLSQPSKPKGTDEDTEIDPASIDQPFFVIKASDGTKMIYREDSVKNLMNNSIVRYNDTAALDVSNSNPFLLTLSVRYD